MTIYIKNCVMRMFHKCFMMHVVYLAATVSPLEAQQANWNHFHTKICIIYRFSERL